MNVPFLSRHEAIALKLALGATGAIQNSLTSAYYVAALAAGDTDAYACVLLQHSA